MDELFGVKSQDIAKHLENIDKEEELECESTGSKMEPVQIEIGATAIPLALDNGWFTVVVK